MKPYSYEPCLMTILIKTPKSRTFIDGQSVSGGWSLKGRKTRGGDGAYGWFQWLKFVLERSYSAETLTGVVMKDLPIVDMSKSIFNYAFLRRLREGVNLVHTRGKETGKYTMYIAYMPTSAGTTYITYIPFAKLFIKNRIAPVLQAWRKMHWNEKKKTTSHMNYTFLHVSKIGEDSQGCYHPYQMQLDSTLRFYKSARRKLMDIQECILDLTKTRNSRLCYSMLERKRTERLAKESQPRVSNGMKLY